MKTAIKLTTSVLAVAMAIMVSGSAAWAQNTDAIDNARSMAKSLQQKQANDSDAALNAAGVPASVPATKPAAAVPAPAVKPAVIPGAKPVTAPAAPKAASSTAHNQLQKVKVLPGADKIQIEISSSQAVTPQVTKLTNPDRILVELPGTTIATEQNKISIGASGVKGVRIGMDGKADPTTSVVVDLEKPLAYDLTPGTAGKAILTLHTQNPTQAAATAPAKTAAPAVVVTAKNTPPAAKTVPVVAKPQTSVAKVDPMTPKTEAVKAAKAQAKTEAKTEAVKIEPTKTESAKTEEPAKSATAAAKPEDKKDEEKKDDKKWAMSGKRDPFFSPVIQQSGSGCSTGKKCLEIGAINLRGVVKSDNGFIAVVTNSIGKAYFLRENDPVFNGFVVKITGDSVVFEETIEDKLGKPFTREVVKRIFTPAV
jgi:hypothetical protein